MSEPIRLNHNQNQDKDFGLLGTAASGEASVLRHDEGLLTPQEVEEMKWMLLSHKLDAPLEVREAFARLIRHVELFDKILPVLLESAWRCGRRGDVLCMVTGK